MPFVYIPSDNDVIIVNPKTDLERKQNQALIEYRKEMIRQQDLIKHNQPDNEYTESFFRACRTQLRRR